MPCVPACSQLPGSIRKAVQMAFLSLKRRFTVTRRHNRTVRSSLSTAWQSAISSVTRRQVNCVAAHLIGGSPSQTTAGWLATSVPLLQNFAVIGALQFHRAVGPIVTCSCKPPPWLSKQILPALIVTCSFLPSAKLCTIGTSRPSTQQPFSVPRSPLDQRSAGKGGSEGLHCSNRFRRSAWRLASSALSPFSTFRMSSSDALSANIGSGTPTGAIGGGT